MPALLKIAGAGSLRRPDRARTSDRSLHFPQQKRSKRVRSDQNRPDLTRKPRENALGPHLSIRTSHTLPCGSGPGAGGNLRPAIYLDRAAKQAGRKGFSRRPGVPAGIFIYLYRAMNHLKMPSSRKNDYLYLEI